MVHNKLFISILIGFIGAVKALPTEQWKAPFNDASKLAMLCTDNNHKFIYTDRMREAISHLLQSNRTSHICVKTTDPIPNTKYDGLIWLIQSIQSCNVVKEIKRGFKGEIFDVAFQQNMLKVAFAMVCQKTDDIGVYNLQFYADIFRILFEKKNEDRTVICLNVKEKYENMYGKCHVINRVNYTTYTMDYIMKICDGNSAYSMIKVVDFFRTFARSCDTPQHFYEEHKDTVYKSFGRALANDTTFMNSLSTHLKSAISAESILPHLMLKTRLLLQHFSIAAIKIYKRIQLHQRCSRIEKKNNIFDGEEEANETNYYTQVDPNEETSLVGNEECNMSESILYDDLMENMGGFQVIGSQAELGIYVELGLLICVVVNSIFLSILLFQTQSHLSTATILFIFNILFSNFLFVASFCVLFSDLVSTEPYGSITENTMSQNKSASYVIAETLQSHLFAPQEFLKHMIQETLFSLSQNGSLLGLTHLLVLVLVVINKSMSGKAIRLSKSCVIMVFAFVWIFLIITHVAFSTLQIDAISNLDSLLVGIKPTYRDSFFACSNPIRLKSEYLDIGESYIILTDSCRSGYS
uniref:G_PROTEIN_RECEP_F1_2 domain-containing protein n=1 Tax=Rhabditophanes sp. KR3021 TaxID=114890 RepID=A0AC35UAI0_9BILA